MPVSAPHELDVGTPLILNAGCDISDATLLEIRYRTPSGATGRWDGTLSGTDYVTYIWTAHDSIEAGRWHVQLYVETPNGSWGGEVGNFTVKGNLEVEGGVVRLAAAIVAGSGYLGPVVGDVVPA